MQRPFTLAAKTGGRHSLEPHKANIYVDIEPDLLLKQKPQRNKYYSLKIVFLSISIRFNQIN